MIRYLEGEFVVKNLILHCFNWKLSDITNNLDKIKEHGWTHIQTSPLQPTKNNDFNDWIFYQPIGFRVGNMLGSSKDLKTLCSEANKLGIKIIVDIVLRHLASDDFGNIKFHEKSDKSITENPNFILSLENSFDYYTRNELVNKAYGLPALNYYNQELQDIYIKFLDELESLGVGGFRIDMAKHIALPSEGCNFFTRVMGKYKHLMVYGECIDMSKSMLDKYTELIMVCSDRDCSDNSKLVTFFESHDTYYAFKYTRKLTNEDRLREWEVLLSRNQNLLWFCREFDELIFSDSLSTLNTKM